MSAAIQHVAAGTGKEYGSLFAGTTVIGIVSTAAWGLGYFRAAAHFGAFYGGRKCEIAGIRPPPVGMTWVVLCLAGAVAVG